MLVSHLPAYGLFAGGYEAAVDALLVHELVMCAALGDFAVVDDEDIVGMADGFEAVGYQDQIKPQLRAALFAGQSRVTTAAESAATAAKSGMAR